MRSSKSVTGNSQQLNIQEFINRHLAYVAPSPYSIRSTLQGGDDICPEWGTPPRAKLKIVPQASLPAGQFSNLNSLFI